jgi:hypothetical protein
MKKIKFRLIVLIIFTLTTLYAQQNPYNGKYINYDGAILIITNFTNNQGFDFTYSDNTKGKDCSGQSWKGKAKVNSEKEAVLLNEEGQPTEITFDLEGNKIIFNIDMNIFGAECQRVFNNEFTKKADTNIQLPTIRATMGDNKYKDWGKKPIEDMGPSAPWTWTNNMCYGPANENVKASSVLPAQGKYSYLANFVCDDDPTTAWVEGNADYGIGEFLEFKEWMPMGNGEISILNGYQASKASWENNSRVKKFKISINGKDACVLELGDVMGVQTFSLPDILLKTLVTGKTIRFTILEIYPGLKWKDTAISGIFSCGG